ncbi:hypothetical protein GOBAR_DD36378 [Gossypium barbadense]|nr:hypothetical protein GOBAR_DD36378 [Gossypium barbadense]
MWTGRERRRLYLYNFVIIVVIVATTRRQLPSDSGAFADWATSSSAAIRAGPDDLSLGFNANAAAAVAAPPGSTSAQWPPSARPLNYGLPSEMGMVASPCLAPQNMEDSDLVNNSGRNKLSGMQLWQNQTSPNYLKKQSSILDNNNSSMNLIQTSGGGGMGGGSGGSGTNSGTTCQDCGNQAKKDCSHRRCRTCCKSRRFDCPTHVRSTWVPAARRRERQLMTAAPTTACAGSSGSTSGAKKPRLVTSQTTTTPHTSTSNTTPRSLDTSSNAGFKETLPGQVRAPAVFKCVRVTAVEDGEDEYAYQAVVKIGGHVFKGFLYDQGVEEREGFPNISELHLGGGSGTNGGSSSSPVLDPSQVYAATGGGLLGGSTYGNPIN